MGFLDNFLKKLGASLATRYGVVSSGEHKGSDFVFGNAPKEKVTTSYTFSQVIFLKDKDEVGRYNIGTDIVDVEFAEIIQFPATGKDGYRCVVTFSDGNTCEVDLFPSKVRIIYANLQSVMLKETREFFEKEIDKIPKV